MASWYNVAAHISNMMTETYKVERAANVTPLLVGVLVSLL